MPNESNVRQLTDHGAPIYPITDRSLVIGLQDNAFATYVMAWDGASTPVPANIPAGVVVTYNGTDYTGTLAASASTAQDLYLVASGSQPGEYDRYITTHVSSTYAWNALGSTAIVSPVIADDLVTNDSSKALSAKQGKILGDKTSELEAKYSNIYSFPVIQDKGIIASTGIETANSNRNCTDYIDITNFSRIVYTRLFTDSGVHNFGLAFYDSSKNYISGQAGGANATYQGYEVTEIDKPVGAKYVRFTLWKDPARGCFWFNDPARDAQEKRIETISELASRYCAKSSFPIVDGYLVWEADGTIVANENRCATDFIDISRFNRLIYARIATDGTSASGTAFYNSSKEFISSIADIDNAGISGYVVEEAEIPEGAVYVRFTLWKTPAYGKFFFADPTRDPEEQRNDNLFEKSANMLNSIRAVLPGKGSIFSYGSNFYANPGSILRIIVDDPNVPTTANSYQAYFEIISVDSEGNETAVVRVNGGGTIQNEYLIVVPTNSSYMTLGGRVYIGRSIVCTIIDATAEHNDVRVFTGNDFTPYKNGGNWNRADAKMELANGSILSVKVLDENMPFEYQVNKVVVNNDHTVTNTIISAWGKESFYFKAEDETYCRIQLRKTDNSDFVDADFNTFISKAEIIFATNKTESSPCLEQRFQPYGFKVRTVTEVGTDFLVKPKQIMTMIVKLPSWVGVQLNSGLRTDRENSEMYYNGSKVNLGIEQGGVMFIFSQLDDSPKSPEYYEALVDSGKIEFIIQDGNKGNVIERNYDAEKYLGAIRATPNEAKDLPIFIHTSDTHGDAERLNNVLDYAEYLDAECVLNTGDIPFYTLVDGVKFQDVLVLRHNMDYAVCIGNHDTYVGGGTTQDIYDKCIAPFAEQYGYEKDGGDVTDKCYYFKDLDEQKIRIIALDIYEGFVTANYKARVSSTQMAWFIDTLSSTPEEYGVIVLMHQAPHFIGAIVGKTDFNDTTIDPQINSVDSDYMTYGKITGNPFGKIIDAFIGKSSISGTYSQKKADLSGDETISYSADFSGLASGVEFIAFLNGHCHRDYIGYVEDCEHVQLNLNIASTSPFSQSNGFKTPCDIMRDSEVNQDAFNVYTINRTDKTVGIARIGSNLSKDLRPRKVMFVRYADDE